MREQEVFKRTFLLVLDGLKSTGR